jgi:hypothetical protein
MTSARQEYDPGGRISSMRAPRLPGRGIEESDGAFDAESRAYRRFGGGSAESGSRTDVASIRGDEVGAYSPRNRAG